MARRSFSLAAAADLLDTSPDTVRRMLEDGDLSGHYLRREKRVYAESIASYQVSHTIKPKVSTEKPQPIRRRSVQMETEAARMLRESGV
jgi:DeoR/GlpR family transcriptional regulator of sugar metabolism